MTNLFPIGTDNYTSAQRGVALVGIYAECVYLLKGHDLLAQRHIGLCQHIGQLFGNSITILLQKPIDIVFHSVRKVFNEETLK